MGWPGPVTERQMQAWERQLDQGDPTTDQWYAMQTAAMLAKQRRVDRMRIKLVRKGESREQMSKEQATKLLKAKSLGRMTMPVTEVQDGV